MTITRVHPQPEEKYRGKCGELVAVNMVAIFEVYCINKADFSGWTGSCKAKFNRNR